jgi:hypothetical protein
VLKGSYAGSKANLTTEADKMPEADYGLKPGSMPEVRTFGQLFAHVAAGQFGTCAAVKGLPNPAASRNLEQDLKTKAEFYATRIRAEGLWSRNGPGSLGYAMKPTR